MGTQLRSVLRVCSTWPNLAQQHTSWETQVVMLASLFSDFPENAHCTWSKNLAIGVNEIQHRLHRFGYWWDLDSGIAFVYASLLTERRFTYSLSVSMQPSFRRNLHNGMTSQQAQNKIFLWTRWGMVGLTRLGLTYCSVILCHKSGEHSTGISTCTARHSN